MTAPDPMMRLVEEAGARVRVLQRQVGTLRCRMVALAEARRSWGEADGGVEVGVHAGQVTVLAAAFAEFLADGTVFDPDVGTGESGEPAAAPGGVPAGPEPLLADLRRIALGPNVIKVALAWVDKVHTNNLSGLENWRNWADDHDVALINAVLAYRGLEPLERTQL